MGDLGSKTTYESINDPVCLRPAQQKDDMTRQSGMLILGVLGILLTMNGCSDDDIAITGPVGWAVTLGGTALYGFFTDYRLASS